MTGGATRGGATGLMQGHLSSPDVASECGVSGGRGVAASRGLAERGVRTWHQGVCGLMSSDCVFSRRAICATHVSIYIYNNIYIYINICI